ncbi:MAG TPA: hypothetical protein VNU68_23220 [Verrucomicrobiae bacterium]|nr:hypothetical protein [Verrucomicrobiae bacterium]
MFGVLIIGRFMGWIGKSPTDLASRSAPAPPAASGSGESHGSLPEPTPSLAPPPLAPVTPRPAATTTGTPTPAPAPPPAPAPASLITDWEQRIDDVLTAKDDENQKVKKLLEIFPNLPEDGQVEAAQHLSNLLPDEQYASLANTLTNAHAPEAVLDVLMTDVLNRPNAIKLATLLDVARTPEHPKAEEAKDVLEVFVEGDCGNNWACWKEAIDKWLKENPDE